MNVLSKLAAPHQEKRSNRPSDDHHLSALSRLQPVEACAGVDSRLEGLSQAEAELRLMKFGPKQITRERQRQSCKNWGRARNPLNALLLTLAAVSYFLGDARAAIVIAAMVVLAITTAFVQEHRSNAAAAALRAMVHTTASVRRGPSQSERPFSQIPSERLGDVVRLSAGDMIPGDLRLLEAKDLFINQSALTGEAMPAEKYAHAQDKDCGNPFDLPNLCFMGGNVVSGYATGVILRTGRNTFFGELADQIAGQRVPTAFDRGISSFTWLMIRFIVVMVPAVFLINGLTKHDWLQALLFAVAVAVGLTPEMLPMIVTVNLAKGAIAMSRRQVISKRLNAIQNFGAMDVLCTDKTGTLTQDRIILNRHLDIHGEECDHVLQYAFLNSHFQSGLRNLLDNAVLAHVDLHKILGIDAGYAKVDEIPFDFSRRRLSVVVSHADGKHILICKGAVEAMFSVCTRYETGDVIGRLDESHFAAAMEQTVALNSDGFRVVAVAYKEMDKPQATYFIADEAGLTLLGYIAFLDPPKESAREAIAALASKGVQVKTLTGDNEVITRKISHEVQLDVGEILLGGKMAQMSDAELADVADRTTVFAKLTPAQKERVVRALHAKGHVVGFLGDGINDSPALKTADVGISVDSAVDIERRDREMIENHSAVPTAGATHPVIFIKGLRHDPNLRGQMRYHHRRHVGIIIGKTAVPTPKSELNSQSKPARTGKAIQQRHVSRRERPIRQDFIRRPSVLHRSSPDHRSSGEPIGHSGERSPRGQNAQLRGHWAKYWRVSSMKPASRRRRAFPTTSSWPNSPPTTANLAKHI